MRLGFAVAAHLQADVLLLDEVFAVGDEAFQRKCFGKIFEFKQRGGTILFVSHDASSVERLCERAVLLRQGEVAFDGPTREAITQYHAQLADEHDPAERGAGLSEWGSREARISGARLVGPDGAERVQFLAGEPFSLLVTVEADTDLAAPHLTYELRDVSNLILATGDADLGQHGWNGERRLDLRYDVPRPPLGDGRFHVRLGLTDASGEHLYHQLDRALEFMVYPGGDERGLVRLDGSWTKETP